MKINLAYKTELDLNNVQKTLVNKAIGGSRFAYNWGLSKRKELYEKEKKSTNAIKQHKELNLLKKTEFPWMYDSSKCVFQEALRDLDTSFKNFFRGLKQGKNIGFPKFKSKHGDKQSFRLTGSIHVFDGSVQLPRLGELKLKENNYLPKEDKILSATVSKHANKYFVSISVEKEIELPENLNHHTIGVDLGIKDLAITSDGVYFENPKSYKKFLKKLKRHQRSLSRKVKGSNNSRKQQQKVAKLHFKISNIRKDNIHKLTSSWVKTKPSKIVIEDLSAKNMMKNHCLSQSIADSSFGEIRRQLEYKCKWNGIELVTANRFFPSSKKCSCCGNVKEVLKLSDRVYKCENCGLEIDRDLNAAINLKNYTESSSEIHASGEKKLQSRNRQCFSVKEEHNSSLDSTKVAC
jgi:putative transposase